MRFNPATEEELQTQALAPEGIYSYEIIQAKEGVSNAGNDKIDLTIKIWNDAGNNGLVFSNLSLLKLLKHFCDVNHMQDQYNSGELTDSMCKGKSGGRVMIGIDPEKQKPDGSGVYKAKNIVKDYITAPHSSTMKPLPEVKKDFDDCTDIPF